MSMTIQLIVQLFMYNCAVGTADGTKLKVTNMGWLPITLLY